MWIQIDRADALPLSRQISNAIKKMIREGTLTPGSKLPSTRTLAKELDVARNTVLSAYDQMLAEGFLESRQGSGTVVTEGLRLLEPGDGSSTALKDTTAPSPDTIDFKSGIPARTLFPHRTWPRLYRDICEKLPPRSFGYGDAQGVPELRIEIAHYLYRSRGLSCDPDRIIITSGSTQGLSLAAHVLATSTREALVEDPTHEGLRRVIAQSGISIHAIPVDDQGLITSLLESATDAAFVYTTPSHQYPRGSVLSATRRFDLIDYARKQDCYVIEDDYDSEFRFEGQALSPLHEIDAERVIYLGSFSKILTPAIRIGFMIVPQKLLEDCLSLKTYSDVHSDTLTQYTLAEHIRTGQLEKHVWRMRKHYAALRSCLLHELERHFADRFAVQGHQAGLHVVVSFDDAVFDRTLVAALARQGVTVHPLDAYYLSGQAPHPGELLMGYAHLSEEEIAQGIALLAETLRGKR